MARGKLIAIEGTDGSGKTEQTRLLVQKLRQHEYSVRTVDFPQYGKTFFGEMTARYLRGEIGGKATDVNPYLASLLYAGDRWQSKDLMDAWLDEGKLIVSNRYVSANKAHQGAKIRDEDERESFFEWLDKLEFDVFGIPRPDITILLFVPYEIGKRLVVKKGKRDYTEAKLDIHESDDEYMQSASDVYLELCEDRDDWVKIECVKGDEILPMEEISLRVWEAVEPILG